MYQASPHSPPPPALRGKLPWRKTLLGVVSILLIAVTFHHVDPVEALTWAKRLSPVDLLVATALLLLNQFISSVRYYVLSRSFGIEQTFARANRINILSIAGGLLFFNVVGQGLTRSSMLSGDRKPAIFGVIITLIERVISLATLLAVAALCALAYFGSLNLSMQTRATLAITGLALAISLGATLMFAISRRQRLILRRFLGARGIRTLALVTLLSLAMHASMLLAYVALGLALLPEAPLLSLVPPAGMVMLGAALPISFGGWGVRELTAAFAFDYVGIGSEAGVTMAVGIGILSILALLIHVGATSLVPSASPIPEGRSAPPPAVNHDFLPILAWLLPTLCAALIGFQIKLPMQSGLLTVNLADAFALCAAAVALKAAYPIKRLAEMWRFPHLGRAWAVPAVVVATGFAIGWSRYGLISWALFNRLIGIAVLGCYLICGALIVARTGDRGLKTLGRTFVLTAACGVILEWGIRRFSPELEMFIWTPISTQFIGFIGNPNALAVHLLIALSLTLSGVAFWKRPEAITNTIIAAVLVVGVYFCDSRSGFVCLAALLLYFLFHSPTGHLPRLLLATAVILGIAKITDLVLPWWGSRLREPEIALLFSPRSWLVGFSEDRMASYAEGLRMWQEHPLFGAGLGAFITESLRRTGKSLAMQNSGLWLLVEMGIAGFLAALAAFAWILRSIFRLPEWRKQPPLTAMIGCFLVIVTMSIAHDMAYQRPFWLFAGALLALPNALRRRRTVPPAS